MEIGNRRSWVSCFYFLFILFFMAETNKWKVIILMGIPGSGKGTQAQLLAKDENFVHISTGQLFRNIESDPYADKEDKELLRHMNEGVLVPDYLVYKLAFHAIDEALNHGKVAILDGAIRSFDQAKEYEKYFESKGIEHNVAVVEISISDELSFKRLTSRKICSKCGYIIPYSPDNFKKETCPECAGQLEVREDDNPQIAIKRIETQGNKMLRPIIDYYKSVGHVFVVDGTRSILDVDEEVRKVLEIN